MVLSHLSDFALLAPHLKRIDLPLRKQLEIGKKPIDYVYFMESGFASVVANGAARTIEPRAARSFRMRAQAPESQLPSCGRHWRKPDIANRMPAVIHEAYLSRAEARRKASKREVEGDESEGEGSTPVISTRPELTSWQTSYVNAHKQAAVRAALVSNHGVAFRLLVAHAIGGAGNVRVTEDHLISNGKETADSVRALSPHQAYEQAREAASRLVGLDPDRAALTGSYGSVVQVFERLMELSDAEVLQVAAVRMAEALATGSDAVDAAGQRLGVDLKGT
jgi:hypothetical protein